MAYDLTIVESVGEALTQWTPTGSVLSVGQIVNGLSTLVTNVSTAVDSVKNLVKNDTPAVDSLQEYQEKNNELLQENNSQMETLSKNIENLTNSIDTFMGFQYFTSCTIFSILFVGFITTRIKKLFTWHKLKKNEGLL